MGEIVTQPKQMWRIALLELELLAQGRMWMFRRCPTFIHIRSSHEDGDGHAVPEVGNEHIRGKQTARKGGAFQKVPRVGLVEHLAKQGQRGIGSCSSGFEFPPTVHVEQAFG